MPLMSHTDTVMNGSIFCKPDYSISSSDYELKTKNNFGEIDYYISLRKDSYLNNSKETQFLLRYSDEMSFWDRFYSPKDKHAPEENHSFAKKLSTLTEFKNYYININTKKLAASNQFCKLRIHDTNAHYTCDASNNDQVTNEMFYMTLVCSWN